jgi:uncharacterized protein YciI
VAALPALHCEVTVPLEQGQAFELFTGKIGEWWPVALLSVFGDGSSVAFTDDGRLLERGGERATSWGEVTDWVAAERVALSWHFGVVAAEASQVTVAFAPYGELRTLVTLTHRGWEAHADAVATREEYAAGWPTVLSWFAGAARGGQEEPDSPSTWAALLFTPAEGQGAEVFDDERFAGHIGFLNLMEDSGYLVAAGPLLDDAGTGMTVLRLPGEDRMEEVERLADVDTSVSSGLFSVRVRPWQVHYGPGGGG